MKRIFDTRNSADKPLAPELGIAPVKHEIGDRSPYTGWVPNTPSDALIRKWEDAMYRKDQFPFN